jgi:hypothetical protein
MRKREREREREREIYLEKENAKKKRSLTELTPDYKAKLFQGCYYLCCYHLIFFTH